MSHPITAVQLYRPRRPESKKAKKQKAKSKKQKAKSKKQRAKSKEQGCKQEHKKHNTQGELLAREDACRTILLAASESLV